MQEAERLLADRGAPSVADSALLDVGSRLDSGLKELALGLRVESRGFRVWALKFQVSCLRFSASGYDVEGSQGPDTQDVP